MDLDSKEETFLQDPTSPLHEEEDDTSPNEEGSFSEFGDEKDAAEIELERLVFGDNVGFRDEIRGFSHHGGIRVEDEDDQAEEKQEDELANLEDADLFFVDADPADAVNSTLVPAPDFEDEESAPRREQQAWDDSDDERLIVSLATVPRLRKLRNFEGEDLISGKEYTKRLRRQYELLNPTPDWAKYAISRSVPPRKRRKSHSSDSSSDSDLEITDSHLSTTQPLAALLRSTSPLTRTRTHSVLRASVLPIVRTRDICGPGPSAITTLTFHPSLPLLLSSGPSGILSLHHVAPTAVPVPNPRLATLHLRGAHLRSVAWDCSGPAPPQTTSVHGSRADEDAAEIQNRRQRIFLAGRRRYFHVWDVHAGTVEKVARVYGHAHEQRSMESLRPSPCGRWIGVLGSARKGGGVVNFLEAATLQWAGQCRVESRGGVADWGWWRDGRGVCVLGKNGEVTEWDVEGRRVVGRWEDEGAVGVGILALGGKGGEGMVLGGDRWVAVGSASGVVNVYDRKDWRGEMGDQEVKMNVDGGVENAQPMPRRPKPTKMLDQLTTNIGHLTFSPDGQLLAMGSRAKANALRVVHLPSCTVYRNWPTAGTKLGRITAVAFGEVRSQEEEGGLYLSVANDQGRIRLWEIRAS